MIKIITDSCADLPKDLYEFYDIEVVPLSVVLEDTVYEDRVDISPKDLMNEMRQGKLPKTTQVSIERFTQVFKRFLDQDDQVIYISFSSKLSGTYESAWIAREQLKEVYEEAAVYVMDSKSATLGQGLVVLQAAKMAKEGRPIDSILKRIAEDAETMKHLFMVEDLNHLYRGGRLSKTSTVVGNLLNIKPILSLEEGAIKKLETLRGEKRAIKRIKMLSMENSQDRDELIVGISHGDNCDLALELQRYFEEEVGCKKVLVNDVGAVIGSHTGPGYVGVFYKG